MEERFAALRAEFPEFQADNTPPWGLATAADFEHLTRAHDCSFSSSYVLFQTRFHTVLPAPGHGFRWVNEELEPYLSLESLLVSARAVGVPPALVPFWFDEGNFTCFDTAHPDAAGEFPVVEWEHPNGSVAVVAGDFISFLRNAYHRFRSHRAPSG